MSILLAKNIFAMLLMAAMGFALVKGGKLSLNDSKSLSVLSLYVLTPCMTLSSFQVQMTDEVRQGLLIAFIGSIIAHAVFIALAQGLKRPLGLDEVERVSVVCSNCGAFVVPLISMVLGSEYAIYGVVYFAMLSVTLWTYGTPLAGLSPNGGTMLLIVLMGASAPSAFLIGQIAQVYGKDFYYASTISVTTLFLSILSVPFLVFLYQL